jgi:hypothetical protein
MIKALCLSNATGLYGMTGTPYTKDMNLEDMQKVFGKVINPISELESRYPFIPSVVQLIYKDNVTRYIYEAFHELKDLLLSDKVRISYQVDYIKETHINHHTSLLLVDRVEECLIYAEALHKRHVPYIIINGSTNTIDDQKNIDALPFH